jgi:hypothetical protein
VTGVYARAVGGAGGDASDTGSEIVTDNAYNDFAVSDDALYWESNQAPSPCGIRNRTLRPVPAGWPLDDRAPAAGTTAVKASRRAA